MLNNLMAKITDLHHAIKTDKCAIDAGLIILLVVDGFIILVVVGAVVVVGTVVVVVAAEINTFYTMS